jgi:hypothetical protein
LATTPFVLALEDAGRARLQNAKKPPVYLLSAIVMSNPFSSMAEPGVECSKLVGFGINPTLPTGKTPCVRADYTYR